MKKTGMLFGVMLILGACSSGNDKTQDELNLQNYGYLIRTSAQMVPFLRDTAYVFLDTRHFSDYEEARIAGAFPADERGGTARLTLKLLDTTKTVVIYCSSAVCETKIFPLLKELGFRKLIYLSDGFGGWVYHGYPVDRGGIEP
ncbi:MAG: rhodanese-like domain-containing protein [Bacteroidetes bacterium]|nr:rhodanese-like domain-containing protein [Bacteroidota bacterium]